MLSKTEREFLQGKLKVTKNYEYKLIHSIKNKLKTFEHLELPLIEKNNLTEFSKNLTKYSNCKEAGWQVSQSTENLVTKQSLERGTNPRPNAYEAFALPG